MTWRWLLLAVALLVGGTDRSESDENVSLKRGGVDFVSPETRRLAEDDFGNPGMLWVLDGERLWREAAGASQVSCASCHGEAGMSMRGTALRYPAFDPETERPIDLDGRINRCRMEHQAAPSLAHESAELLSLSAYVTYQSRGMSFPPILDEKLRRFVAEGESLFQQPIGQLDLSCAACHDERWGKRLGSHLIPQGHPDAYPLYRLEWQSLGSLQRRLRNCMIGVRAEPYPYGASELIALELYLKHRAEGLDVRTPGVRP